MRFTLKYRKSIPDLRNDAEITLEHAYVLVEYFGKSLDLIEGTVNAFDGMANDLDPNLMKDYFDSQFEPEAFTRLFGTEMGKGLLIGCFAQSLLSAMAEDMENLEDEA